MTSIKALFALLPVAALAITSTAPTATSTPTSTPVPDKPIPLVTLTSYVSANNCTSSLSQNYTLRFNECTNISSGEAEEFKYVGGTLASGGSVFNLTVFEEQSCTGVNVTKKLNQQDQCQLALNWFKDAPEGVDGIESAKFAGSVRLDVV